MSDKQFPALEAGASRVNTYEPNLIHGLLQTAGYARALFNAGMKTRTESWIDNQVAARMIRQERLVDENHPLALNAVVSEFALWRPIGGAAVMRAQLRHLALVTELPTVTLRVLPASVVTNPALTVPSAFSTFRRSSLPWCTSSMPSVGRERTNRSTSPWPDFASTTSTPWRWGPMSRPR